MGGTTEWKSSEVRGMDTSFIESSNLMFANRAEGYESDEQIINALLTEPNVAIVDSSALSGGGDFGSDDSRFTLAGVTSDDETFAPVTVDVLDPETGEGVPVKVIGVLDSKISTLMGMYANQETIGAIYPTAAMTSFYMTLADDTTSDAVAKQIEANLLSNGVQSTSIQDELEESQRQSAGFLKIVEGFMGLGLIVGIAAVGVISFRSVVERRQQIGVLRAIGFQRGLVSLSFLIETAFLVGVGIVSGTSLGIVLARNLTQDDEELAGTAFLIPWQFIGVVMAATVAVALVMAWIPSRQAARIAPAEALRYE
jgi:putative ABC transport system permease protein